ncbi:hypothetical protein SEVIR_4G106001v4 [Setaria viridis]|uniref:Uncharacterized protein n=1 Tax=Setaria viridis TaxID=4556 RepID=A0A4U6V0G9_SETVI|nr:hypothetical protein SEVIR_4G106001v2 [Setaria viridis]
MVVAPPATRHRGSKVRHPWRLRCTLAACSSTVRTRRIGVVVAQERPSFFRELEMSKLPAVVDWRRIMLQPSPSTHTSGDDVGCSQLNSVMHTICSIICLRELLW